VYYKRILMFRNFKTGLAICFWVVPHLSVLWNYICILILVISCLAFCVVSSLLDSNSNKMGNHHPSVSILFPLYWSNTITSLTCFSHKMIIFRGRPNNKGNFKAYVH
jgi:hypothetical protein